LQLHVHTAREVMIGSILGLATSLIGMLVLF
jgi:acid phosphatase family membrane protein YuiD